MEMLVIEKGDEDMFFRIMNLCREIPRVRVQVCNATTAEVLFEGVLEDCPYRVCEMEIEKVEATFVNGIDYIIFAE